MVSKTNQSNQQQPEEVKEASEDEEALIKDLENGLLEESDDDAQMQEDGGN